MEDVVAAEIPDAFQQTYDVFLHARAIIYIQYRHIDVAHECHPIGEFFRELDHVTASLRFKRLDTVEAYVDELRNSFRNTAARVENNGETFGVVEIDELSVIGED